MRYKEILEQTKGLGWGKDTKTGQVPLDINIEQYQIVDRRPFQYWIGDLGRELDVTYGIFSDLKGQTQHAKAFHPSNAPEDYWAIESTIGQGARTPTRYVRKDIIQRFPKHFGSDSQFK